MKEREKNILMYLLKRRIVDYQDMLNRAHKLARNEEPTRYNIKSIYKSIANYEDLIKEYYKLYDKISAL